MNEETKKIRDELAEQLHHYQEFGYAKSSKQPDIAFKLGFDAGHATAMKDVGALIKALEEIKWSWDNDLGRGCYDITIEALSRFTQNQTEKGE